jgi:hypothetical protein
MKKIRDFIFGRGINFFETRVDLRRKIEEVHRVKFRAGLELHLSAEIS